MRSPIAATAILAMIISVGSAFRLETRDYSELDPLTQASNQIRWHTRTVEVAFSTSLNSPGANIKPGSDVVGAARRALARWSSMANINFVVTWSAATSVSPATGGDGISLLTIADTLENEAFNADSTTGRTRVFFDPETGAIAEADISINPRPRTAEGAELQFSTDGTAGTYDLEATFTHEIGHLLGLDHSAVLASTMQSRQGFNGTYGLPAFTERTLSEEDRQRVRSLYGPKQRLGRIEGRFIDNERLGTLTPTQTFNVWAENVASGRVVASSTSGADGSYQIEGLPAGQYRVLATPRDDENSFNDAAASAVYLKQEAMRSFEVSSQVTVKTDAVSSVNFNLLPQSAPSTLAPRWVGLRGELSAVALPVEPGKRLKIYLGGDGVDQVPGTNISVSSPYFTVDASSLSREQLFMPFPVISFEVNVAANAPFGDYSLRLQSNSGETAFVPGALTIDPGVNYSAANPIDDTRFFVLQHYADLANSEPEPGMIEKFASQLAQCGTRAECLRARRLDISTSVFLENSLQPDLMFLHGLYVVGLGRRPRLSEFETDRKLLERNQSVENNRARLALSFVRKPEFVKKYPASMNASEFLQGVLSAAQVAHGVDLSSGDLAKLFDGTEVGRAKILSHIITAPSFADAQYNQAFVQAQYFGFLRRDPDESGFKFWVGVLRARPLRDPDAARSMICAFVNSSEYQLRFGLNTPHNGTECGN